MTLAQSLVLVFYPTFYIILSTCALAQFSLLFNAVSNAAYHMERSAALEPLAPLVKTFVKYLESIFGPAYKFVPVPTHVFLVALMLVILVHRR